MSAQIIALPVRRNSRNGETLLDILDSTTTTLRARKGKPPLPPASALFQQPLAQGSTGRTARQKHLERAKLLHDIARDLGMSITVHPMKGGAA